MITAAMIRSNQTRSASEEVDNVLSFLVGWAKRHPDLRNFSKSGEFWTDEGLEQTDKWNEAKEILEARGFKVEFYNSDLDLDESPYTLISW